MNPTFIKFEKNQTPMAERGQYDPLGIATIGLYNNQILVRYVIKAGKEGRGFYISEFSQKLNGQWNKSITIDSVVAKEQIEDLIKKNLSQKPAPVEAPQKTYAQPSFGNSECPF